MNPTEIDDALVSERRIEPSAAFQAQVMRAVHARAALGRPSGQIWRAAWPALAVTSVVVALVVAVMLLERAEARAGDMSEIARWLSFSLTGTYALAWRSARQSGMPRSGRRTSR